MRDAPDDVVRMLDSILDSHFRMEREIESDRAKRDPEANKLTRVMADGKSAGYRYYPAGKDGRGWAVWFCWSCHRNAAGYFLGWREVRPPKGSKARHAAKRDKFVARKVRRRAQELALRRATRFATDRDDPAALKRLLEWQEQLNRTKTRARERAKGRPPPAPKPSNVVQFPRS